MTILQRSYPDRQLNVLVATPAGGAGQGGIDRVMAALHAQLMQRSDGVVARLAATRGTGSLVWSGLHLLRFCARMVAMRVKGELDVVHVNLASSGSTYRKMAVAACAKAVGVPYVLHLHGAEFREFWSGDDTLLGRAIRALFENAARIIVLGTPWQAFVARKAPAARGRIVIVPNAVQEPGLPHVGGGGSAHILFLGRIGDRKGVPELVKALARMRDMPGWRATIAGDGAVEELRAEIDALGLADRVTVPGWLGAGDMARLLATGDILTLPSYAENLPMSVIEAMASGLGVVTTPVGAVEDIIRHGETGLLVAPGDHLGLADALSLLVREPELRRRIGAAARAFQRENLSIEPYAERVVAVWREAVAAHHGGTRLANRTAPVDGRA